MVAPKLSLYFGTALEFGIYSQNFKAAKVVTLFKSGNKKLLQNYRPIFLFPSLSKVLDKLIKKRLINFFVKHKFFYNSQCGFRESMVWYIHYLKSQPSYTTEFKKIFTPNGNGPQMGMEMDLQKEFDTVSHPTRLHKSYHYGILGPAFSLRESYLSYRRQFVFLNNCHSTSKPIYIGIS